MPDEVVFQNVRTSWRYNLTSGFLAFFGLGAWAWHVNSQHLSNGAAPWASALTQGCCSFASTLVMVHSVTWLFRHLPPLPCRFLWPACLVVSSMAVILFMAHWMIGTRSIAPTIAPGLTIACGFNLLTTYKLTHAAKFSDKALPLSSKS